MSISAVSGSPSSPYCDGRRSNETASSGSPKRSGRESAAGRELTEEEQRQVAELKHRDAEVRAHEQAHLAAGGAHVRGGATYTYDTGPDGRRYAVGGEVSIDTSPEKNPQATIRKMQTIRKAALAPSQPSGQDLAVAAAASQQETKARQELKNGGPGDSGENPEGKSSSSSASGPTRGYASKGTHSPAVDLLA